MCTSRRIGVARHMRDGGEGRAVAAELGSGKKKKGVVVDAYSFGQGHFGQWSTCWRWELVYQRRRGGRIFIRPWAFRTMEHLLATRVSLPASPRRMHIHSARGISDNEHFLVTRLVYLHPLCQSGRLQLSFFYIGFWRWRVVPTLFFLNWNLLPSNIRTHKQHQKIHKKYEQFIVGNLVFE
jgi:hypothetical protein